MTITQLVRVAGAVTALAVATGGLAACGAQPAASPVRLGIVLGERSNSSGVTWADVDDLLPGTPAVGTRLAVVGVDGSPSGVTVLTTVLVHHEHAGDADQALLDARIAIHRAVVDPAPAQPEADVLGAVSSAARSLRSGEGPCRLVVADSLVSTAGALDLRDGTALAAAPEDVAESLRERDELPDLTGCDVVLRGAGQVVSPQQPLDEARQRRLRALWTAVLSAAGASSLTWDDAVTPAPQPGSLPPVTPVVFPAQQVAYVPVKPCAAVLDDATVGFQPDTADFVDPATAQATIAAVAGQLADCPKHVTVTGTTSSWGSQDGRARLSLARATTVRDALATALGVAADTIDVAGVGTDFPEFVTDRDGEGHLVPSLAAQNRTVRITTG